MPSSPFVGNNQSRKLLHSGVRIQINICKFRGQQCKNVINKHFCYKKYMYIQLLRCNYKSVCQYVKKINKTNQTWQFNKRQQKCSVENYISTWLLILICSILLLLMLFIILLSKIRHCFIQSDLKDSREGLLCQKTGENPSRNQCTIRIS